MNNKILYFIIHFYFIYNIHYNRGVIILSAYKEIVTKAIIGKGKKYYKNTYTIETENEPTTVLGCWVINHKFKGSEVGEKIVVDGSFDVNIWYSYDNDSKTDVIRETNTYNEVINMRNRLPKIQINEPKDYLSFINDKYSDKSLTILSLLFNKSFIKLSN